MAHLEPFTPTQDKVAQGHANIVVNDLTVTLRCIVVAEHLHRPDHLDSGGVCRDEHDTLLAVLVRVVRVALTQDQVQSAARVAGAADVPAKTVSACREPGLNMTAYHLWPLMTMSLPS